MTLAPSSSPALPTSADLWLPGHRTFPDLNNPFTLPDDAAFGEAAKGEDYGFGNLIAERIPPARKFKSSVFMCIGRRGAGKTLAVTNFLMTQKERFRRAHSNRLIITNYNHRDADLVDPLLVDHLGAFQGSLKDADIGIDEIQGAASSRRSLSMANINMGIFLTQIRKRDMSLWCTCQFPQMMDFWLLMQVDLFLRCEMMPSGKMWIRVHDYWGLYTGNDTRKPFPPRPDQYDWDFTIENPERAYGHYNTNEVVAAIWAKNRAEVLRAQGYDLEKLTKADDDRRRKEKYGDDDDGDGFTGTPAPPKDIPTGLPNNEQLYRQHVTSINLLDTMSAESKDEGWVKLGAAQAKVWKLMGLNKGKPGVMELGDILSGLGWEVDDTGRPETDWKARKR